MRVRARVCVRVSLRAHCVDRRHANTTMRVSTLKKFDRPGSRAGNIYRRIKL